MSSKFKIIIPLLIIIVTLAVIFYAYQKITGSNPKGTTTTVPAATNQNNAANDQSKAEQAPANIETPAQLEESLPPATGKVNDTIEDSFIDIDNEENMILEEEDEEVDEFSFYSQVLSDLGDLGASSEL